MPYTASPDACLMFLVRHGATANNLQRPPRLQGRGDDVPLSDEGREQARKTADFLDEQHITGAFSSPLARAQETAGIIAEPHQLAIQLLPPLEEVDVGDWEGMSWSDIQHQDPDTYRRFMADPATCGYPGGENLKQVQQRVLPAAQQLARAHLGQVILVVAHNVVNRVLLATILGVPLAKARSVDQDNCGVNVVRWRRDQWKVLTFNATFHLR